MPNNRERDARLAKLVEVDITANPYQNLLRHKDGREEVIPDFNTNKEWFQRLINYLKAHRSQLLRVAETVFPDDNEELIEAGDIDRESKLCALIEENALSKQSQITEVAYRVLTSQ